MFLSRFRLNYEKNENTIHSCSCCRSFLATSCSSSFLDTDPTDAVSSDKVSVPENAEALVNGAWYNLFDYSSTYANIGYRALQCLDDMMASDVVSRPKYGFNSSYQFNDIALSSNSRTEFAWYLIYIKR